MRFIDRVRIEVRAGDGGDGSVSWRREAHVPKGGPAGGDGGDGGDIWVIADVQLSTLLDLKYRQHHRADPGRPGAGASKNGRAGEMLELRVPIGTSIYYEGEASEPGERPPWFDDQASKPEGISVEGEAGDGLGAEGEQEEGEGDSGLENVWIVDDKVVDGGLQMPEEHEISDEQATLMEVGAPVEVVLAGETISSGAQRRNMEKARKNKRRREYENNYERGQLICDLDNDGERVRIARGGIGGRGNVHFRSSTNRSPDRAEPGTAGEKMWLRLELKLLADVGIVGYPNVGKSTLITRISRARPEIGAYPFTTLVPQLGVVALPGDTIERSMVVADVPGLVDGASEGRGLGHEFLRHLERTRVLLHLIAPDPTPGREPLRDLDALEQELRRYGPMFEGRPRVVALNKVDTPEGREMVRKTRKALRQRNIPLFAVSALTGEGTEPLLEALWRRLQLVARSTEGSPETGAEIKPE